MTITGASLSAYDEVLKTFYLPAIREQLNNENALSGLIDVNEEDVSGKNFTINCHYGRSTGTGARADGGDLPTASYQKYKTMTVPMKFVYGRVEVTGPTLAATRDERGAYANALDSEIMGIVDDLKKEHNRMDWGTGYGVIGRWLSGTDGTVWQKAYRGNSAGGDGFGSAFGGKYVLERGDAVAVLPTISGGITVITVGTTNMAVTAITESTGYDTMTCTDPSITEVGGTFFVRPASLVTHNASSSAGAARLEPMGLRGLVTNTDVDDAALFDGTYTGMVSPNDPLQGLAVATYPWWKAIVMAHPSGRYAGQRALSFNLMQTMFDKVEKAAGKGVGPNLIMTTQALRREYIELCQANNRTINERRLDGGWDAVLYNNVPILVDPIDAIDGEVYFLTTQYIQRFRMADYQWMQKDGAVLSRVSGKDAYEATLFRYSELGCSRRNTQGVLCDIAYTD